jgi:hypothetical protein
LSSFWFELSFRQRSFFASTRNLVVIPTEKLFCFDEESRCHSDREALFASTRNLNVIPTEKFFGFDEESQRHSDKEVFLLRRGIFRTSTVKILQSPIGSFRMTVASCHSDREAFLLRRGISMSFRQRSFFGFDEESECHSDRESFASTRNLNFIPTKKFFCFDEESLELRQRFFSRKKLLQNDSSILSFRQRSFFASTRNLFVIQTKKLFCFDEESQCHSDKEAFWL